MGHEYLWTGGRVSEQNLPSFAQHLGAVVEVEGLTTLQVDTAFWSDSFVLVDARALGFALRLDEAADLAALGMRIINAATEQLGFTHPTNPDWRHISFCGLITPVEGGETRHAVSIQPGKIDRPPTGTCVSARLAILPARGQLGVGDRLLCRSIIDSRSDGRIVRECGISGVPAIIPEISGRAWIAGTHQHMLDPNDPWPGGYRIRDTWPCSDIARR